MWQDTRVTRRLGIGYPIVQGPFGGGLSSPQLAAAVSNAGGLGSFGAQGMTPDAIRAVVADIRSRTGAPFAVNLWVSTADAAATDSTRDAFDAALAPWRRSSPSSASAAGVSADRIRRSRTRWPRSSRPGRRSSASSSAFHPRRSWIGAGLSTSPPSAPRPRSMRPARSGRGRGPDRRDRGRSRWSSPVVPADCRASLMGTLSLVPQVVDAVKTPVIAAAASPTAGRRRGARARRGRGAGGDGVPRLRESNAHPAHRTMLRGARQRDPAHSWIHGSPRPRPPQRARRHARTGIARPSAVSLPGPSRRRVEAGGPRAGAVRPRAVLGRPVGAARHAHARGGSLPQSGGGRRPCVEQVTERRVALSSWLGGRRRRGMDRSEVDRRSRRSC